MIDTFQTATTDDLWRLHDLYRRAVDGPESATVVAMVEPAWADVIDELAGRLVDALPCAVPVPARGVAG